MLLVLLAAFWSLDDAEAEDDGVVVDWLAALWSVELGVVVEAAEPVVL